MIALRSLVIAACLIASACQDSEATPLRCGDEACSSKCEALAGPPCDLLDADCRERILSAVICVRGTPGRMPEVRTLTDDEYRLALRDGGADTGDASQEDAGTEKAVDGGVVVDVDRYDDPWSIAFGLLGVLPNGGAPVADAIDDKVNLTAGYYDSRQKRITLIDHGERQDDVVANAKLAHELVHALQDQRLGLYELAVRAPGIGDGAFAHGCLIEGDADFYADMALALLEGVPFDHELYAQQLRAQMKYARDRVLRDEAPYRSLWLLRYPIGAAYVHDAYLAGGNWAVQALFETTPSSSIQWMIGYPADRMRREHVIEPLACDWAARPDGYEQYSAASFGAAMFYAFLGHVLVEPGGVLSSEQQWRNALHWRQDEVAVFQNASGQIAVSYRVRLDDEGIAKQLETELSQSPHVEAKVVRHGRELELLAAQDLAVLDAWQTDPDACPPPP